MQGPIEQVLEAAKGMKAEEPDETAQAEAEQEARRRKPRGGLMAEHNVNVRVLTPEGEVFAGEVQQLSTRTAVGELGILANHVPVLARLRPTELRLHMPDGEVQRWAQAEGWLQVFANRATVLVGEAIPPDNLDAGELRTAGSRTRTPVCARPRRARAPGPRPRRTRSARRRSSKSPAADVVSRSARLSRRTYDPRAWTSSPSRSG